MRLKRGSIILSSVAVTAFAASASAQGIANTGVPPEIVPAPIPQPTPSGMPIYTPEPGERPAPEPRWMPASNIGLAILAGGGVTDFTQGGTRSLTGVGGSWTVRFAVATRYWVGFEGSYVGGANSINGLGLASNANLVRNGIEGALRINAPLHAGNTLLEPYILGGVGWNGYRVTNVTSYTASVTTNSDNTLSVPLGVGFSVGYKGFMGDLRYTIRPTYQQTILATQGGTGLSNWDAGAMIGYEF